MTPTLVMLFVLGPAAGSLAEATEAFEEERWADAAVAFRRVYEADPKPKYLYAQAQALRFDGNCEGAIDVYEAFIEASESAEADAYGAEAIEVCRAELDDEPEPEPEPEAEPEPPPPTIAQPELAPPPDEVKQAPSATVWYRDRLAHGLSWSGVALSVAGGVMVGLAQQRARVAEQQSSEVGYRQALENASVLNVTGFTALGLGATLIAGGVVRFIVVSRTGDRRSARVPGVRF